MTEHSRDELAEAIRYAAALRSAEPLPEVDDLPLNLAPRESATLRAVVTYERRYPVGPETEWGDRQGSAVIATGERLLIDHRFRGWLSFWLADLGALEPALNVRPARADLTWTNGEPPLRLSGPGAATIAVHVAAHTDPSGWTRLPALKSALKPPSK